MSEFIPNLVNPNPKAQEAEEVVEEEIIEPEPDSECFQVIYTRRNSKEQS